MPIRVCDFKHLIDIYARTESENEFGENEFKYKKIKQIHASISTAWARQTSITGEMEGANVTHRIIARSSAIPNLSTDMYFICKGQKLSVLYWYPIYKKRGFIEIYCKLVLENG